MEDDNCRPQPPVLEDWLQWVWRAWSRLRHDRPWIAGGMAAPQPGRIPWSAVMAWADRHGYPPDRAAFLDRCCQALDGVYLEWWKTQQGAGG